MPYLTNVSQEQISRGPSLGTVRVHWVFGNMVPDLIEIRQPGTPPILFASVAINKSSKTPTSVDFSVPAPTVLSLVVSPRTIERGILTDKMPDDSGALQYWEHFSLQLANMPVSPVDQPPPRGVPAPIITDVQVEEAKITIHWTSQSVDHFNIRIEPWYPGIAYGGNAEIGGGDRSLVTSSVPAGSYRFSIEACIRNFVGVSICSPWVGKDIVMPPALGFVPWRKWFPIHPETIFNQITPVAVHARREDHLDVFKVGFDGAVWSSWWHDDGQNWRPWFQIHPETVFRQDRPVTAVARVPEHIDLFRVGLDGAVWSSWWHDDDQNWRPWFQIHPETRFPAEARVAAVSRHPDHLDVFAIGFDGAVWSSWWHDDGQNWRPWFQIHPETIFARDQQIVAISRQPGHLDLFTVGLDGAVWSSWWHDDGQNWRPWFQIHPETRFAPATQVAAIARQPDHLDLFISGHDGAVWSSFWHDDGQNWRPWFQIHPETVFAQNHPVAAAARKPELLDLFKVGFDGAVWSDWWSPV
jgi:hypothetical protein